MANSQKVIGSMKPMKRNDLRRENTSLFGWHPEYHRLTNEISTNVLSIFSLFTVSFGSLPHFLLCLREYAHICAFLRFFVLSGRAKR